ncbi:MAG: folate-binding protein [Aestuariivirga sp.]
MATMQTFSPHSLADRTVIALRGDGILSFLHNILTCNVENLIQGEIAYGALLSPQGKILHDMFVHHVDQAVLIDCAKEGRDDLIAKLKLYRLRAKFEIVTRDDLEVVVGAGTAHDPRLKSLGFRGVSARGSYPTGAAYDDARYNFGIADSSEIGSGKLFPHEANFDQFSGVDFNKGCYIGQEVVSRMQHRGTARSRILPVAFQNDQSTDEIRVGNTLVGEVLGRRGKAALALIRMDRLAEVGATPGITITKPNWMKA